MINPPHMDQIKGLPSLWKALSAMSLTALLGGIGANLAPGGPGGGATLGSALSLAGAALTLFAFAVGDLGLTRTVSHCLHRAKRSVKACSRGYALLDTLLVVSHGAALLAFAWYSTGDAVLYLRSMTVLAGLNVIWIALRLRHFVKVLKVLRASADGELLSTVEDCCSTMVKWTALNGGFIVASAFVSPAAFPVAAPSLILARSLLDLMLCGKFYNRVLCGDLPEDK